MSLRFRLPRCATHPGASTSLHSSGRDPAKRYSLLSHRVRLEHDDGLEFFCHLNTWKVVFANSHLTFHTPESFIHRLILLLRISFGVRKVFALALVSLPRGLAWLTLAATIAGPFARALLAMFHGHHSSSIEAFRRLVAGNISTSRLETSLTVMHL